MDLISIVVPVYNIENYIRECVDSIRSQTYSELEILLVDDGSSDKSGEICDEYSVLDERVKVIHKSNGGLSDARNCGIKNATGKWIAFIDGDDWIHPRMIEVLHKIAIESESDISCCRFNKYPDGTKVIISDVPAVVEHVSYERDEAILNISAIGQEACNKLCKINIFDDVTFPVGRFHEDEFTIHRMIWNSKKIVRTELELYFYRQRQGSIMNAPSIKSQMDAFDAYDDRICFVKEKKWNEAQGKTVNDYMAYLVNRYLFYKNHRNENAEEICRLAVFKAKQITQKYSTDAEFIYRVFAFNRFLFWLVLAFQGKYQKIKNLMR